MDLLTRFCGPLARSPFGGRAVLGVFGLAWLLTISTPAWPEDFPREELQLFPPGRPIAGLFGYRAEVSGDVAAIGTEQDDVVYIFQRSPKAPQPWRPVKKLTGSVGFYGWALSLDGERLAVGAFEADRVHLYERHAGGKDAWGEVAELVGPGGTFFGWDVDLQGDRLVVGAEHDSQLGSWAGAAYIYDRDPSGNWVQSQKLLSEDGEASDFFGDSVAVDGDRVAVGAITDDSVAGSAFLFELNETSGAWEQQVKLSPSGPGGWFGASIELVGSTMAIGAELEGNENGGRGGAAYVYEENEGGLGAWGEVARLFPSEGGSSDRFGKEMAFDGERLVIGNYRQDSSIGMVYLYERNEGGPDAWGEVLKLTADDGEANDSFGLGVGLDGNTLIVGAASDDDFGLNVGKAYSYLLGPELWTRGECPGDVTIGFAGGTPGSNGGLGWSTAEGVGAVPRGACAGTELGLETPQAVGALPIDEDGEVLIDAEFPASVCSLYLQAMDLSTCGVSYVTRMPGG